MRKAQSLIVQFIIFFIAGFALFIGIGSFLKFQSDVFREDITDSSLELTNSYLSSLIVTSVDSCKQCDYAKFSQKLESRATDYFLEFKLGDEGLNVSAVPGEKFYLSSIHNLNESFDTIVGKASSIKPINLTFSRTKNELRIE